MQLHNSRLERNGTVHDANLFLISFNLQYSVENLYHSINQLSGPQLASLILSLPKFCVKGLQR